PVPRRRALQLADLEDPGAEAAAGFEDAQPVGEEDAFVVAGDAGDLTGAGDPVAPAVGRPDAGVAAGGGVPVVGHPGARLQPGHPPELAAVEDVAEVHP